MSYIFRARTNEANFLKITVEILANNLKTGCFVIDKNGIRLRMADHHLKSLFDVELNNFTKYNFNLDHPINIGINLAHFNRVVKSIKRKDSLELLIKDLDSNDLIIKVIPKERTKLTKSSSVKIQNIQNIEPTIPEIFGRHYSILSSEFQRAIKEFNGTTKIMKVMVVNEGVKFCYNEGDVIKTEIDFECSDDRSDEDTDTIQYSKEFEVEQLSKNSKISSLSSNLLIHMGNCLKLESQIGGIGKLSIYIKSTDPTEFDNKNDEDDSDSE